MAYTTKFEVQRHLLDRGFDKEFIKQKCRATKPLDVDDDWDFNEGPHADHGDGGSTNNLISSLIIGAIHGEISKEPNESA
jgi:hypothetical protein